MTVVTSGAGTVYPSTTLGHFPLLVEFLLLKVSFCLFFIKMIVFQYTELKLDEK